MTNRVCVWNLSPETTQEDLYALFGQVARVISVKIPTQPDNHDRSMGLGFVEIETGNLPGVIEKTRITELNGRTVGVGESLPSRIAVRRIGVAAHQDGVNLPVRRLPGGGPADDPDPIQQTAEE